MIFYLYYFHYFRRRALIDGEKLKNMMDGRFLANVYFISAHGMNGKSAKAFLVRTLMKGTRMVAKTSLAKIQE